MAEISAASAPSATEHKSVTGRGGHRIEASRNFWDGSGLKVDSSSTDVVWGHGGELVLTLSYCLVHSLAFVCGPLLLRNRMQRSTTRSLRARGTGNSLCGISTRTGRQSMVSHMPIVNMRSTERLLERRIRDHVRSIHVLQYSPVLQSYCMTGSADGDIRVWVSVSGPILPSSVPER